MSDQAERKARGAVPPRKPVVRTSEKRRISEPARKPVTAVNLKRLTNLAGYLIRRAQLWVFREVIEALEPLGLRPAQYAVLAVLADNRDLSQQKLADALGILRSGMVPLLDNLERRRLIVRVPSAVDRRTHALRLTADGNALLAKASALIAEHENRLKRKVGPQGHKQLLEILSVFTKH